jgi:hypothetical protein
LLKRESSFNRFFAEIKLQFLFKQTMKIIFGEDFLGEGATKTGGKEIDGLCRIKRERKREKTGNG